LLFYVLCGDDQSIKNTNENDAMKKPPL